MKPGTVPSLALAGALLAPILMVATAHGVSPRGLNATSVRGRVTFDRRPVHDAGIVFCAAGGSRQEIASAPIRRDGSFGLELDPGRYEIAIMPASAGAWRRARNPDGAAGRPAAVSPGEEQVPMKFRFPTKSGLSITIGERAYRLEIDLGVAGDSPVPLAR
jgi:hypothetical protein